MGKRNTSPIAGLVEAIELEDLQQLEQELEVLSSKSTKPARKKPGEAADAAKARVVNDPQSRWLAIALSLACEKGKLSIVSYLLDKKRANPNATDTGKPPPLLSAAEASGHDERAVDIVRMLLQHGADPNVRSRDGKTALMLAKNPAVAEQLLQGATNVLGILSKANVHAEDNEGRTALMNAQDERHVEILLRYGAELEKKDNAERSALMIAVIECEKDEVALSLIEQGADVNSTDSVGRSVLVAAVWKDRVSLVKVLLQQGASVSCLDSRRRNVYHHIAMDSDRGAREDTSAGEEILRLLRVQAQPGDIHARDNTSRMPLHWAAATNNCFVVEQLLDGHGVNIHEVEMHDRTALHLAVRVSVTVDLEDVDGAIPQAPAGIVPGDDKATCQRKLEKIRKHQKIMEKLTAKKTAREDKVLARLIQMIDLLLLHGASIDAESDGGWTVIHTAAANQTKLDVFERLLAGLSDSDRRARLHRRTSSGKSAFHIAAEFGNVAIVEYFLADKRTQINARDNFGNSPLLCAAAMGHRRIVELLAPYKNVDRLDDIAKKAAQSFHATIVRFGDYKRGNRVDKRQTVFDVIYSDPGQTPSGVSTMSKEHSKTNFKWIHLPVNNVAWCQDLLTKHFVEEGARDAEGFKALERSFMHQHRGQRVHASYMRPMCHAITRMPRQQGHDDDAATATERPFSPATEQEENADEREGLNGPGYSERFHARTATDGQTSMVTSRPVLNRLRTTVEITETQPSPTSNGAEHEQDGETAMRPEAAEEQLNGYPPRSRGPTRMISERDGHLAPPDPEEHGDMNAPAQTLPGADWMQVTADRARKKDRQPPQKKRRQSSAPRVIIDDLAAANERSIFLFAPYLHFETDQERKEMQSAIMRAGMPHDRSRQTTISFQELPEELLLRAHLHSHSNSLHIRRTLDQSFFRNIDTSIRDEDQVIYKYEKKLLEQGGTDEKLKVLMVDQLWMWILGKDLIVTSFPQRWRQPRKDPLNVLEGIIEELNVNTGENVRNIYELAALITARCFGAFDCSGVRKDGSKFLDMFESSIGFALDEESQLFARFKTASKKVSDFLQRTRQAQKTDTVNPKQLIAGEANLKWPKGSIVPNPRETDPKKEPPEIALLMEIGSETALLAEVKDIRDELDMLKLVFVEQQNLLPQIHDAMDAVFGPAGDPKPGLELQRAKVSRRLQHNERAVNHHVKEIERMDKQAERIYFSIRDLLDLKQKYSNASEARYARYEAAETAHQGVILMVFTVVTVIFLPLSFIAAFFAISINEFPHRDGSQQMPIDWVLKYMFGIGLPFSAVCVIAALSIDQIAYFLRRVWWSFKEFMAMKREARREERERQQQQPPPVQEPPAGAGVVASSTAVELLGIRSPIRHPTWQSVGSSRLSREAQRPVSEQDIERGTPG